MWNHFSAFEFSGTTTVIAPELGGSGDKLTPEQRLLLAVMEQAIRDVLEKDKPHSKQAERWFFEDWGGDSSLPFSLSWICRHLDLDMGQVQGRVREFIEYGVPRQMAWAFRR